MHSLSRRILRTAALVAALSPLADGVARGEDPVPPAGPAGGPEAAPKDRPVEERVDWRTGDELSVRVLGRTDLSGSVRVLADGTVDVPFAGRFVLTGRTIEELRKDVEAKFEKNEKAPQVAITVQSLSADEFFVLGEVGKAGMYSVARYKRVSFLQAIGMAGGFSTEADFANVQIVPANGGKVRAIDASPRRLGSLSSVTLVNGDTIVVPSVGRIYLMGQVNRTGGFAPPAGETMTLSRAVALGGGFTRLADTTDVRVTWRNAAGEAMNARFNMKAILAGAAEDVVVYPGNLIYVPERFL